MHAQSICLPLFEILFWTFDLCMQMVNLVVACSPLLLIWLPTHSAWEHWDCVQDAAKLAVMLYSFIEQKYFSSFLNCCSILSIEFIQLAYEKTALIKSIFESMWDHQHFPYGHWDTVIDSISVIQSCNHTFSLAELKCIFFTYVALGNKG